MFSLFPMDSKLKDYCPILISHMKSESNVSMRKKMKELRNKDML